VIIAPSPERRESNDALITPGQLGSLTISSVDRTNFSSSSSAAENKTSQLFLQNAYTVGVEGMALRADLRAGSEKAVPTAPIQSFRKITIEDGARRKKCFNWQRIAGEQRCCGA
jgi:hypothetical protein